MLLLPVTLGKSSIGALAFNASINWPVINSDKQAFYYVMK
jgi:tRNA A37 N6-isopentenylltransferase MiaA